jgi:hypothetical protein
MLTDLTPSDELVKQAAFNRLDPELWNVLTDDDHIEDFHVATKALRRTLQTELITYRRNVADGCWPEDAEWRDRASVLHKRTSRLQQALLLKIKDRTRRHYDQLGRIRYKLLRQAIIAHQEATLAGGEPTEQDRLLWAALGETWAMGSDDPQPVGRGGNQATTATLTA